MSDELLLRGGAIISEAVNSELGETVLKCLFFVVAAFLALSRAWQAGSKAAGYVRSRGLSDLGKQILRAVDEGYYSAQRNAISGNGFQVVPSPSDHMRCAVYCDEDDDDLTARHYLRPADLRAINRRALKVLGKAKAKERVASEARAVALIKAKARAKHA